MERTREHKKREDYRQGGRVQLARGKGVKPKKKAAQAKKLHLYNSRQHKL